jgi:predicted dehydrogenase
MSGGGALIDIGVHVLDLALYLLGNPRVEEVSAVSRADFGGRDDYTYTDMWGDDRGPDGFDVDDSVTAFIRCEGGKTISLDAAWATNRRDESRVTLVGTDGGAEYDFTEQEISFFDVDRTPESDDPLPTVVDEPTPLDGHEHELNYFVSVIRGETPHTRNTVDQAYTVQRVIDAIYASSEDGHAVSLTEPTLVEHNIAD